jgi:hypothetical protein
MRVTSWASVVAVTFVLAGCSSDPSPSGSVDPTEFAMQVASTDLYVGPPQRVQVGVVRSDPAGGVLLLTSGTLDVTIAAVEGGDAPLEAEARYVPAPGTDTGDGTPALTSPDVRRGVYQTADIAFPTAGVWTASTSFEIAGETVELESDFTVRDEPVLPAPGQDALPTQNLTMRSDVDPQAIDSRATDGTPVPDPDLHGTTIADAMKDGSPVLALFATPVYCQSQFCGPTVDALEAIRAEGPNSVRYIHVEIWHDYQASEINEGAADWLLRDGDLTEPWLFLIDGDGTIVDRWGPLFDPAEVLTELEAVTP